MVKVLIQDDLHLEFMSPAEQIDFIRNLPDADIIILAGDISNFEGIHNALLLFIEKYSNVIYTYGNHELYGGSLKKLLAVLKLIADDFPGRFHLLNNSFVEINGQRFIGGPMFFPWEEGIEYSYWMMNDFSLIENFAGDVYIENKKFKTFIENNLKDTDIVVTHYIPSYQCVHSKYKYDQLNKFFVSEMGHIIKYHQPKAWIFGHTHESCDMDLHGCHMIANPYGYHNHEINANYIKDKFIEL